MLRGNFDNIRAAYAQVEPLIANRAMRREDNLIGKRTPPPAVLIRRQRQNVAGGRSHARSHARSHGRSHDRRNLVRARPCWLTWRLPISSSRELNQESIARKQR